MYTTTQLKQLARNTYPNTTNVYIHPNALGPKTETYTATIRTPDGTTTGLEGDLDEIFQGIIAHSAPWGADMTDAWHIVRAAERRSHSHYARETWGTVGITRN